MIAKRLTCLLVGLAYVAAAGSGPAIAGDMRTRGVVELFTSQGCSSCPPADALMTKLSSDPTLVTLSFAVDYWNYLGWKDTFSRPEFTQRQRDYAAARGDRDVYTPQVVIDGQDHAIGSDADHIAEALALHSPAGRLPVPVAVTNSGDSVFAQIGAATGAQDTKATVWLIKYSRRQDVAIGRGENSGRTVTYANIVTEMQPVGVWKGAAMQIELPRSVIMAGNNTGFALILQTAVNGKPGPILGATVLTDGPRS